LTAFIDTCDHEPGSRNSMACNCLYYNLQQNYRF